MRYRAKCELEVTATELTARDAEAYLRGMIGALLGNLAARVELIELRLEGAEDEDQRPGV